jgi:phage-related protein (TIGR01555 family)
MKRKTKKSLTPKAKQIKIREDVLAKAAKKEQRLIEQIDISRLFSITKPPPGVVPEGAATLGMDSCISSSINWATGAFGSAFAEGQLFLGYSYLAELAQRPEYRVITETIATEMTRKWIKVQATGDEDKTEKVKQLESELERLKVREAFKKCVELDGFFGRGHLYLDTGKTDERDELKTPIGDGYNDISKVKIKKGDFKRLMAIEPVWTYPTNYNSADPLMPNWYKPEMWFVMGKEVHASRLLTFIGREVPDLLKPAYSFGGLSMSQMAKPYVDNFLRTRQSVSDLVHAFTVFALMTDMQSSLSGGNGDDIFSRAELFNRLRDNKGLMLLNKDSEDLKNISAPLSTLDNLQAQSQEQIASVSGIPLVKLTGISPAGLNASSEGEIRVFYDKIAAYQEAFFDANLKRVFGIAQLSLWGKIDPDLSYSFVELWELDKKEKAEVKKIEAETGAIYVESGTIDQSEERKRIASDPETPYPGLDPDELPDLKEEEAEGLDPEHLHGLGNAA